MSVVKRLKKSNVIVLVIILVLLVIISILLININTDKVIISSGNSHKGNINNSNALTMMYETEADSGEYQVSSDTTWPQDGYVFNETLSKCENGSKLIWDDENKKVMLQANTSDRCYVYFDKEPETLANYIINNVYTGTDGDNGLYYHDGIGSYINADQEAGDNSFRYSGANPNNYVCFGSDEEICPADNLYRIIGVFGNQVKLIKAISYGDYIWEFDSRRPSNTWNETTKPDIYMTLNTTYYNTLDGEWQNLIAETIWQVGGISEINGKAIPKKVYDNEVGTNQTGYEETMKIGLMYVSDYGFAANSENWNTTLNSYNNSTNTSNNWIYLGSTEWTISRTSDYSLHAFFVYYDGAALGTSIDFSYIVRPSFYLNPDVTYISGTGTESDPFRIA